MAELTDAAIPDTLDTPHVGRRLIVIGAVVLAVGLLVLTGPGLGTLRNRFGHASPPWVVAGIGLELLSSLSYVVLFRAVFCRNMSWRLTYQMGMAEQGANSVLLVSGAGGLALGAWVLRRGGVPTEFIVRRSVAFFFLTTMANVSAVILFVSLYGIGALGHDPNPSATYAFGGLAVMTTVIVLSLAFLHSSPSVAEAAPADSHASIRVRPRPINRTLKLVRHSLTRGVQDGISLLAERPTTVLLGSVGFMAFDLAVLGVSFKAFGYSAPFGILVLGYQLGQLGGTIPVPGGIGGLDAGLVGAFAAYHQQLITTAAGVFVYHMIALWVPALLGSVAFVQLRRTLTRDPQATAICAPLASPL